MLWCLIFSRPYSGEEHDREQHENDRRHLENELRELRTQLGKSAVVVGDYADLRRELERSEKQRDQLSDHLQVCLSQKLITLLMFWQL